MVQIILKSLKEETVKPKRKEVSAEALLRWAVVDECVLSASGLLAAEAACDGMHLKSRAATGLAIETLALSARVDSSPGGAARVADDALVVLDVLMGLPREVQALLIRYAKSDTRPLQVLPGALQMVDAGTRLCRSKHVVACGVRAVGPTAADQTRQQRLYLQWFDGLCEFARRVSIERGLKKHRLVAVLEAVKGD